MCATKSCVWIPTYGPRKQSVSTRSEKCGLSGIHVLGPDRDCSVDVESYRPLICPVVETTDIGGKEICVCLGQFQSGRGTAGRGNDVLDAWEPTFLLDRQPKRPTADTDEDMCLGSAQLHRLINRQHLAIERRRAADEQFLLEAELETALQQHLVAVGGGDLASLAAKLNAAQGITGRCDVGGVESIAESRQHRGRVFGPGGGRTGKHRRFLTGLRPVVLDRPGDAPVFPSGRQNVRFRKTEDDGFSPRPLHVVQHGERHKQFSRLQ